LTGFEELDSGFAKHTLEFAIKDKHHTATVDICFASLQAAASDTAPPVNLPVPPGQSNWIVYRVFRRKPI
jgi:hypothetical protein